jgi:hypothetical protein
MTTLTQEQRKWLNKCVIINGIKGSWTLNLQTGLIDVEKDFNCMDQGLTDFKGVKFGRIGGFFHCSGNSLTSLEGAPHSVGEKSEGGGYGYFDCSYNAIVSLVGSPQKVKGHFYCIGNRLTSLEGAPQRVGGDYPDLRCDFDCSRNRLISLEGAPQRVSGDFDCEDNPVSEKTLLAIFDKIQKGDSFMVAAASLRNKMSEKDWKLITTNIPEAIRPGVSMLARFGAFG